MYAKGHAGLTFLIMSLLLMLLPYDINYVTIIALSGALSALPDLDLKWQKAGIPIHHRGPTHSILFALVVGMIFGGLFGYSQQTISWALMGFISGFMGVISHLIGDTFTHMAFKPLWPFDDREVSFGFCKASNRAANEGLASAGSIAFVIYILNGTGALSPLLSAFM